MVSAVALGKAKALKEACLEAVKESVDVAKNATGRRFEPNQTHNCIEFCFSTHTHTEPLLMDNSDSKTGGRWWAGTANTEAARRRGRRRSRQRKRNELLKSLPKNKL